VNWLEQAGSFQLYTGQRLAVWLWAAAGLLVAVLILHWYAATRRIIGDRWRRMLAALRMVALAFLVLYLVNPILSYRQRKVKKGAIAIAIDTSRSMMIADSMGGLRRFDAVRQLLTARGLLEALSSKGPIRLYGFGRTAQPLTNEMFWALTDANGDATDLAAAVKMIAHDASTENFVAAVVFSDGRVNVRDDPLAALTALRIPIQVVGVGQIEEARTRKPDIALGRVEANPVVTRNIAATVRVYLRQYGFSRGLFPIQMTEGKESVAARTVTVEDLDRHEVDLQFTPRTVGVHNYEIAIPVQTNEAIAENNRLRFSILVNETTLRVLYLEGALRWEYKYIKRMLDQDPTVESLCMVRTGAEHFLTAGRAQVALKDSFPAALEELAKFRVLIVGDLPRPFWTAGQMEMIEKYVSEREGGLLLLGGPELFCSGAYADTPLGRLSPAELAKSAVEAQATNKKIVLTRQSTRSEIFSGMGKIAERIELGRHYPLGRVKPAAEALLETSDGRPLLAAHRYGKGRVVALATDGLWRSALAPRQVGQSAPAEQLWRQLIQWLSGIAASDQDQKAPTLLANTDRTYYEPGRPIVVRSRVNRKAVVANKVKVEARFLLDGAELGLIALRPDEREIEYSGSFEPPRDGQYEIVAALVGDGKKVEQVSLYATSGHPYRELEETTLNEPLLRNLAAQSGGRYYSVADAAGVADQIERAQTEHEERIERQWLASPTVFVLFAALLSAEWYLRRRKRLI